MVVPNEAKYMKTTYSYEQRTWLVSQSGPLSCIQWKFSKKWPYSSLKPSKQCLWKLKNKFKKEGTINNLNKGRSGRKRSIRTESNIQKVC